jgi:tetratricopeptide (TPR) repeat protein
MIDNLRDELNFLLNSLRDLEKERTAGDIDEIDYATLRDGYVARAAALSREIEGIEQKATAVPPKWSRRILATAVVIALGVGGGVLLARNSGQRIPGETFTGGIEQSTANVLANARQLNFSDPVRAIELYSEVLKLEPDNVEALTYRSWMLALSSRDSEGSVKQLALTTAVTDLIRAQRSDPSYPDSYCFLGIVYFRFLEQASLAKQQLDVCASMNPPASVSSFVSAIIDEVNAAVGRQK